MAHSHWLGVPQQQDADDYVDIRKTKNTIWFIVDNYSLDEQWQKRLEPYYEKLMVIDHLADSKHHCNIFLDQNFRRNYNNYKNNKKIIK